MSRNGRIFWAAAFLTLAIDIATKWLVERHLQLHVPVSVIGDSVRLTLTYNPGASFGMHLGDWSRYLFGAFAVAALFLFWRLYRQTAPTAVMLPLGLGLVWGGAAGNLFDRIRSQRGVVDFIDVGNDAWRFFTFNGADSGVFLGAVILIFVLARGESDTPRLAGG